MPKRNIQAGTSLSVDINLNNIFLNPVCDHGPTIQFERHLFNGESKKYYACSAFRDRKFCTFYLEKGKRKVTDLKDSKTMENKSLKSHKRKFRRYVEIVKSNTVVGFCNTCSEMVTENEVEAHKTCTVNSLSIETCHLPTQILTPKSNPKCEAQYFFTDKSLQDITRLLQCLQAKKLLCVGAPRIHEILNNGGIKSILLDIDDRFCNFFSVDEFIPYNIFNHYFFNGSKSREIYLKFLKGSEDIVLLTDPPFGGRMELISNTLKLIEEEWRKVNNFTADKTLPVLLVFPYFQEKAVKSSLPSFSMLEYIVDYDNHALYTTGPKGMKRGSAVRIFTNLPPDRFPLPEEDGYSFCRPCKRWVHPRNSHCLKCGDCTSKDGSTYTHCDKCGFCVKPKWNHCISCCRCLPRDHKCKVPDEAQKNTSIKKIKQATLRSSKKRKGEIDTPKVKRRKSIVPQTLQEEKTRDLLILKEMFK